MIQLETIMILHQDLTTEQYESIATDYADIIKDLFKPSSKIKIDLLGKKKLSYEIKSCTEGWYLLFTYNLDHPSQEVNLRELERRLRIDDQVIKFLTTKRTGEDIIHLDKIEKEYDWRSSCAGEKSEQPDHKNKDIDAMDVLLGFANYS